MAMLVTRTEQPTDEWKQEGLVAEHDLLLDDNVLLHIEEYKNYYSIKWDTHLSGSEGYKLILDAYEALKKPDSKPRVSMLFGGRAPISDIPLELFLRLCPKAEYFDDPSFSLFNLEFSDNLGGTTIIYQKGKGGQGLDLFLGTI